MNYINYSSNIAIEYIDGGSRIIQGDNLQQTNIFNVFVGAKTNQNF